MKKLMIVAALVSFPLLAHADKLHLDICLYQANKTFEACVNKCGDVGGSNMPKCMAECYRVSEVKSANCRALYE